MTPTAKRDPIPGSAAYDTAFPNAGSDQCDDPSTPAGVEDCTGYELTADIDLNVAPYNTGSGWEPILGFGAAFNGNNHTISGLFIDRGEADQCGAVRKLCSASSILRNVALVDVDVTGGSKVGAFVGSGTSAGLDNVFASGRVTLAKAGGTSRRRSSRPDCQHH